MSDHIRIPNYNKSIGKSFEEVIENDAKSGLFAHLEPTRTNADGSVAMGDDVQQVPKFGIDDLVQSKVNRFRDCHDDAAVSNTSVAAALNIICKGMTERKIINTCSVLVACGLSAGRDAFPPCYVTHVERIGSYNGRLKENYDEIMNSADTAEGLHQNYNLFMLKKQDRLALRWLEETGSVRHIAGRDECIAALKADPLEPAPLWEPMRPGADMEYGAERQYDRMNSFMTAALKNLPGAQPK